MVRRLAGFAAFAMLAAVLAPSATRASEPFPDLNVRSPTLKVNRSGRALVEYTTERGLRRHVFVWGAVNARSPSRTLPQVRFRFDFAGGWRIARRQLWRTFVNRCRRYDGPPLAYFVAGCKAPDGSYWALQSWQRRLPLLGFTPWLPVQDDFELHVSHWSTELPVLEAHVNWTFGLRFQGVFGRLSYLGSPVHGFSSTSEGSPRDRYGRNVYIDTFNSAYGAGWRRDSGILTHRETGTFCHSFVPQSSLPGYPSQEPRPAGNGERYRITASGPGVTPVLAWEAAGLPAYDSGNSEHALMEGRANAAFDRLMAGDRRCAAER